MTARPSPGDIPAQPGRHASPARGNMPATRRPSPGDTPTSVPGNIPANMPASVPGNMASKVR